MMPVPTSARTVEHSPSPGACLDDLLASRFLPRRRTERICSARGLPPRLRRCTSELKPGTEWRAYGDEGQIFFAIARMHATAGDDGPSTAIEAYFLDENAAVYAAGVWDHDRKTGWCLDAVMEPSYDSEHGWWLGELMESGTATGPAADEPAADGPAAPEPAAAIEFRRRKPRA